VTSTNYSSILKRSQFVVDNEIQNLSELLIPSTLEVVEEKSIRTCTISATATVYALARSVTRSDIFTGLESLSLEIVDAYDKLEVTADEATQGQRASIRFDNKASALAFYRKSNGKFLNPKNNVKYERLEVAPGEQPSRDQCYTTSHGCNGSKGWFTLGRLSL
jgi:hypothetical protein